MTSLSEHIQLPHKRCDYNCPWNAIEDMYEWKTGKRPPAYLFFGIAAFCSFIYLKISKPRTVYQAYWNSGLPRKMYDFMCEIIGYDYKLYTKPTFDAARVAVKKSVDKNMPAFLGALDMFYLPYYGKFYHQEHIPIHYILMTGYDDDGIVVLDNDKADPQHIPYTDLRQAWNVETPGFSKPYTYLVFTFEENIRTIEQIIHNGLQKKCDANLNAPVSFIGINGIRKLAKEFPAWQVKLDRQAYRDSLAHFVEYAGFPPMLPPELSGKAVESNYSAARDVFANVLEWGSEEYSRSEWHEAAALFRQSGETIEKATRLIRAYFKDEAAPLTRIPDLLEKTADLEEKGYRLIADSLR